MIKSSQLKKFKEVHPEAPPMSIGVEESFEKCNGVQEYFERQVDKTPQNIALEFESRSMTYLELEQKSNQLAHFLREIGVGREVFVSILMERSFEMFIAILGVLKAGGAYVPLDPEFPQDRLSFLIEEIEAPIVLTQSHLMGTLSTEVEIKTLCLDSEWTKISKFSNARLPCINNPEDAMFMAYTSGSTGKPKGCINVHRGLANFLQYWKKKFPLKAGERLLHKTPFTFVASVPEIFRALFSGATVVIAKPGSHKDPAYLIEVIREKSINDVQFVPSMLLTFLQEQGIENCTSLFRVISAGEPLPVQVATQFYKKLPHAQLVNRYGGTEVSVSVTIWECNPKQEMRKIPIGFPIANTRVYILDESLSPVPAETFGEIYIGGVQVCRGYWKRPELTKNCFIKNPFTQDQDSMIFKTGDRARFLRSGALEYQGRNDFRVKLRGMRVEPGEVESVLLDHPQISQAVVVAKKLHGDEEASSIVAYLVGNNKASRPSPRELREFLKLKLPEYMVPAGFIFLETLPRLVGGKISRKDLMERHDEIVETLAEKYSPPINETEKCIIKVWEKILKTSPIGRQHNYFALGGDSLNLVKVFNQLKHYKFGVTLRDLSAYPTVVELAKLIDEGGHPKGAELSVALKTHSRDGEFPVTSTQAGFFFLQKMNPKSTTLNAVSLHEIKGDIDEQLLKEVIEQNLKKHQIFYTKFKYAEDRVVQVIVPEAELKVEIETTDLSVVPPENQKKELLRKVNDIATTPFDLEKLPLFRFHLFKLGPSHFTCLRVNHHIINDYNSDQQFFGDVSDMYESSYFNKPPSIQKPEHQFADYAVWESENITDVYLKPQLEYWKIKLSGASPCHHLPLDFPRPAVIGTNFNLETIKLPIEAWEEAKQIAREGGISFFQLNLALFFLFLHRYSDDADVCLGTAIDLRPQRGLSGMMGPLSNNLVLRSQISSEMSFLEFSRQIAKAANEAYVHADVSFDKLVNLIKPKRTSSYSPIYQIMFDLWQKELALDNRVLRMARNTSTAGAGDLDLMARLSENDEGVTVGFRYNADLFESRTILKILKTFATLYEDVVSNPQRKISEYRVLPSKEVNGVCEAEEVPVSAPDYLICVAATFTAEPMDAALKFWLEKLKLPCRIEFAPLNQVFQELITPSSILSQNTKGINFLLLRFEDWKNPKEKLKELVPILKSKVEQSGATYVIVLCPPSQEWRTDSKLSRLQTELEGETLEAFKAQSRLHVILTKDIIETYPVEMLDDAASDSYAKIPYTREFYTSISTMLARKIYSIRTIGPKVIVLDCDNTLWRGVVGEDGIEGVRIDPGNKFLQEFALEQSRSGVLICLCSKNNEGDVWQIFDGRHDMVLKKGNVVGHKINWDPKSRNIMALARELNLGVDSFVFIDDSPVECSEVRTNCPGAFVIQLPQESATWHNYFKHLWVFDKREVTDTDRKRTEMYLQNSNREKLKKTAASLTDFIASLNVKINFCELNKENLARVAQMTQRTSQFNFTTLRRSEADIGSLRDKDKARFLIVDVSDRFGDYGIVGLAIIKVQPKSVYVDTFLLSCRALGRGVEQRMLYKIGEIVNLEKLEMIEIPFNVTPKNKPAAQFLDSALKEYRLSLKNDKEYLYKVPASVALEMKNKAMTIEFADEDKKSGFGAPEAEVKVSVADQTWLDIASHLNEVSAINEQIIKWQDHSGGNNKLQASESAGDDAARMIMKEWESVIETRPIGREDNYFALGGDSLGLLRVLSRLQSHKFDVTLEDLYTHQTISELSALLRKKAIGSSDSLNLPLVAVSKNMTVKRFPLSWIQEGFLNSSAHQNYAGQITVTNGLEGKLNILALKESFKEIIRRHWILRTKFFVDGKQEICEVEDKNVEDFFFQKDFRKFSGKALEKKVTEKISECYSRNLDIKKSPLVRCDLLRLDDEEYLLILSVHHVVFDGMAVNTLREELKEIYSAKIQNRSPILPELPVQYGDFAIWERKSMKSPHVDKKLEYWRKALEGTQVFKLPYDYPAEKRDPENDPFAEKISGIFKKPIFSKMQAFCKRQNSTIQFMVLAAFSTLLHRWCEQDRTMFYILVSSKPPECANLIGYFMSVLPIQISHEGKPSHKELLDRVRTQSLLVQSNQVPTVVLRHSINNTDGDAIDNIPVIFNFVLKTRDPLELSGMECEDIRFEFPAGLTAALGVFVAATSIGMTYEFVYDGSLFKKKTMTKLAKDFEKIILEIVESDLNGKDS